MPDRIADLMAWGLSEGVARRVASRDRPVGPVRDQRSDAARPARREVTPLKPSDEQQFQAWVTKNHITDLDHPDSHYDYRGYWKDVAGKGVDQRKQYDDGLHFPDTYKQHGHPTFSVESKYSSGPNDGGAWYGETFIPQRAVGPVRNQQSAPQIVAGLSATRDRLAQQTPTERLIAGIDPTLAGPRRNAAPTVTLASLSAAPTPRANVGTMLDLLQTNPEATQADLAELEAATQPRRSPVIRASTLSERFRDKYYDLFESAARQPIGRIADALGLSDLQCIANERATGGKLMMATAVPPPGEGILATVAKEAQAARALTKMAKRQPQQQLAMDHASRMGRAESQGFTIDGMHGRAGDYREVAIPSWRKTTDSGAVGEGFYAAPATERGASTASFYADMAGESGQNVMPVKLRIQNPLVIGGSDKTGFGDPRPAAMRDLSKQFGLSEQPKFNGAKQTNPRWAEEFSEALRKRGYDGVIVRGLAGSEEYMVLNPSQVRSKFAVFDPKSIGSSDLMAGVIPFAAAIGATKRDKGQP